MKTEYLREFVVLAQCLNFSIAAEQLYVAQSTLSSHVAQLEAETGLRLVDRSGATRLTEEGVVFLEAVKESLSLLDEAVEHGRMLQDSDTGSVRIACSYFSTEFALLLKRKLPAPPLLVMSDLHDSPLSSLASGRADILITYDLTAAKCYQEEMQRLGLVAKRLHCSACCITAMANNPLSLKENLTREDIRGAEFVIHSATEFSHYKALVQKTLGNDLDLKFRLDPIESLSDLTLAEYGNSLHLCGKEISRQYCSSRDDIVFFDSIDGEPLTLPGSLIYRSSASPLVIAEAEALFEALTEGRPSRF